MTEDFTVTRLGVVGAGTMGAGIAQVSASVGIETTLYDISASVLDRSLGRIRASLQRLARGGRISEADADATLSRIQTATASDALRGCEAIIEAAPEDLETKRDLFVHLDAVCPPPVLLATNTSSLSITEVANRTRHPERCVGMHFFNPPVLMKLVEVIPGVRTSSEATERGMALARQLGKTPVEARDTPGFIVNRVIRPFYLEALRILGENIADVRTIDRIIRVGGGFPMGPFELIDLVGVDVNFAVSQSVYESFFQPARFRPHLIQRQMVQAGLLGRKSGHGFYEYQDGKQVVAPAQASTPATLPGPVAVVGDSALANQIRQACQSADVQVTTDLGEAGLVISAAIGPIEVRRLGIRKILEATRPETEVVVHCGPYSCTELVSMLRTHAAVAGFNVLGGFQEAPLVELAQGAAGRESAASAGEAFFRALGKETARVSDGPGMVLGRIIAAIANEGLIALNDGLATAKAIDVAVKLGANHPRGPIEWADAMGLDNVYQTLRTLQSEMGDAYTPAVRLRRLVQSGKTSVT